jgi:hypothetical protein
MLRRFGAVLPAGTAIRANRQSIRISISGDNALFNNVHLKPATYCPGNNRSRWKFRNPSKIFLKQANLSSMKTLLMFEFHFYLTMNSAFDRMFLKCIVSVL